MIQDPKKTVSVVMPMDLYLEIQKRARESNRTVPSYIRQVLIAYFRSNAGQDGEWNIDR